MNGVSHTFPDDIDMLLVGPGGNLIIMSDVGGSTAVTGITLTLDDAAANSMTTAPLVTGTFKPTKHRGGRPVPVAPASPSANTTFSSTFNGTTPNGTWSLYVVDDLGGDVGSISGGWTLTITTGPCGCTPTTFTNSAAITINDASPATPYPSNITVAGLTGTITKVTAKLNGVSHTFPSDIDILLVGPGGNLIIMSDVGDGTAVSGITLTLDDAAANSMTTAPLVTGTFKPTNIGAGDPSRRRRRRLRPTRRSRRPLTAQLRTGPGASTSWTTWVATRAASLVDGH